MTRLHGERAAKGGDCAYGMTRRSDSEDFIGIVTVPTLGKGLRNNQCYGLQGNPGGYTVHLCASEKHRFFLIDETIVRDDIILRALWMREPECVETGHMTLACSRAGELIYNLFFFF